MSLLGEREPSARRAGSHKLSKHDGKEWRVREELEGGGKHGVVRVCREVKGRVVRVLVWGAVCLLSCLFSWERKLLAISTAQS